MICDINGDNNKILVTPTDLSNCDYLYGPYWTYDGKSIVFSGGLDKVEYYGGIVNTDGSNNPIRLNIEGNTYDFKIISVKK